MVRQARKRHININFFVRLVLGQTRVFSLFYTVKSLGQSRGQRAAQKVYVKNIYVPFSLASSSGFGFQFRRVLLVQEGEGAPEQGP